MVGQLEVVDFTGPPGSPSRARTTSGSRTRRCAAAPGRAAVRAGKTGGSNTGSAEAAVRLVSVMRQFEMLQKAVSIGPEMNRQAIEEVAKVG